MCPTELVYSPDIENRQVRRNQTGRQGPTTTPSDFGERRTDYLDFFDQYVVIQLISYSRTSILSNRHNCNEFGFCLIFLCLKSHLSIFQPAACSGKFKGSHVARRRTCYTKTSSNERTKRLFIFLHCFPLVSRLSHRCQIGTPSLPALLVAHPSSVGVEAHDMHRPSIKEI